GHGQRLVPAAPPGWPQGECLQLLLRRSQEAKTHAYCPYSRFPVGAALLTASGEIFSGKPGQCDPPLGFWGPPRTPLAMHGGAVGTAQGAAQVLHRALFPPLLLQFGTDWDVYLTKADGTYIVKRLEELLPLSFGPEDLKK
ncbi:CDD deaminase, partial [Fregetta grallaria]|nr:CDD deaminase [Fregetta grallaria]